MLPIHSNLAYTHHDLKGQLNDLFAKKKKKNPYDSETMILTNVVCQHI